MTVYFIQFVKNDAAEFAKSSYNSRVTAFPKNIIRGDILTADGKVIATTVSDNDVEKRYYEYPNMFCHLVGYVSHGLTGVEKDASEYLLADNNDYRTQLQNEFYDIRTKGDDVYTTIDYKLQRAAYDNFGGYKGAIIAIEPSTGKVLCMVSKPDFNLNSIEDIWKTISTDDTNSVLLNRATQGMYPPGSTFKVVTSISYMRQHPDYDSYSFNCTGSMFLFDRDLHCVSGSVHGKLDFTSSLAHSCNCSFANMGLHMDLKKYKNTCEDLYFNKNIPTSISNVKKSSFTLEPGADDMLIGSTAMGQGNTLVTPLQMCFIVSAIANGGEAMEPYYIDKAVKSNGEIAKVFEPKSVGKLLTKEEAKELEKNMRAMIQTWTGRELQVPEYVAYGKTGTAEISSDSSVPSHSWFVGFARDNDDQSKQICVAAIMEQAGAGSHNALPLAKKVFDAYFNVSR